MDMFNLKSLRKKYNLTQAQMGEILGCGQTNISEIERNRKDIDAAQYKILCELYGEDNVSVFQINDINDDIDVIAGNTDYETYLLPQSAMGGSLSGFAEDGVTLQNCEKVISPIKGVDFAITVYGESMSPEYPSGSRVLIKKIDPSVFIDWGKVYVLDTSNGVIIKELHKNEKGGYITCHSINSDPKFADFDLEISKVHGFYRVLMCLSAK